MASKSQICNMALTRLASSRLTTLDDGTSQANDCNAIFEMVVKQVIGDGDWPSARSRAALAQVSDTPVFGYKYMYQLPTNPRFIGMLEINNRRPGDIKYIVEGDKLLTDESVMHIRYACQVDDSEQYDIYLEQAIIDRLVAELAYKTTGQVQTYQLWRSTADKNRALLLAKANIHDQSRPINSDTFIDVRLTGDTWGDQE